MFGFRDDLVTLLIFTDITRRGKVRMLSIAHFFSFAELHRFVLFSVSNMIGVS
jgi:hypothetical protein